MIKWKIQRRWAAQLASSCIFQGYSTLVPLLLIFAFLTLYSGTVFAEWQEAELRGHFKYWSRTSPVGGEGLTDYSFSLSSPVQANNGNMSLKVNRYSDTFVILGKGKLANLGPSSTAPERVVLPDNFNSWFYSSPKAMAIGNYYYLQSGTVHVLIQPLKFNIGEEKKRSLLQDSQKKYSVWFRFIVSTTSLDDLNARLKSIETPHVPSRDELSTASPSKRESLQLQSTQPFQKWAVIVGVSSYADTRIPALRYASADAQAFFDWAISPSGGKYAPSHVKLLLNEQATNKALKNALFGWLKQALEEDMVMIYFAGHGSPESPDSPNNLFLLPYDTEYENISSTGFPMWDIETALERYIKAKKVVVIADACHSGGVGQSFDVARRANRGLKVNQISNGIQNLTKVANGICVISASDEKQYSQESSAWGGGHGVFTYFLLKGLKGDADYNRDTSVTLGELTSYLSQEVRRATKNAQCPTVAGRYDPALTIGK